jgi:hypothetical protein
MLGIVAAAKNNPSSHYVAAKFGVVGVTKNVIVLRFITVPL